MTVLLEVRQLKVGYGPVDVIRGIDLDVVEGEIRVLLGANGAGKTTTLRALSGLQPARGSVRFLDADVLGRSPADLAKQGMNHVPQGRGTFNELTVDENMQVGAYPRRDRQALMTEIAGWYEVFPVLGERRTQPAGSLSGGEQQMLAIARALMNAPRLLLLDEPSLGLAPLITAGLFEELSRLNASRGLSMLIVEQNANLALNHATYGYVLESGEIALSGPASDLVANDSVRRAYLGI